MKTDDITFIVLTDKGYRCESGTPHLKERVAEKKTITALLNILQLSPIKKSSKKNAPKDVNSFCSELDEIKIYT